jgi:uncharacterized SAM-binding protein YcdF (DUF218 family)
VRDRSRSRGRALVRLVVLLLLAAGAAWLLRRPLLRAAGAALIAEDPLEPVAVIVVSTTNVRATALEAGRLYRDGIAPRLLIPRWRSDDLDAELARRGVHYLDFTGLARAILVADGVPAEAITLLPGDVDGTGSEIAVIANWARTETPASLLYLTARNHTARARRRLRTVLPPATRVSVRASRWDRFAPDGWWRRRGAAREVLTEYIRWLNTFVIGDPWLGRLPG